MLPVSDAFEPVEADAPYLTESLAKLGYPGLAYVRTRLTRKNPAEVLLTALIRQLRESRGGSPSMVAFAVLAEGIYLVIGPSEKTQSPESFGVCCQSCETGVRERSSKRSQNPSASRTRSKTRRKPLGQRRFFLQATRTPGEREWLLQNRPEEARHWNLLADLRPEHLQYAR